MEKIPSTQFKNSFNRFLALIQDGARYIVTHHGKAVAAIYPIDQIPLEATSPLSILAELEKKGIFTQEASKLERLKKTPKIVAKFKGSNISDLLIEDRQ